MERPSETNLPVVRPQEVVILDQILASSGRIVPAAELARSGRQYRLVDRSKLTLQILHLVDTFVEERIRQAQRDMARLVDAREAQAFTNGQDRALSSLVTLADLVDNVIASMGGDGGNIALRALGKRIDAIFKTYGYSRIETIGQSFDSRLHEVVEQRSQDGVEPRTIIEEISRGYARDGYVLLVAKVVIAA
jgi:hypothetical protein